MEQDPAQERERPVDESSVDPDVRRRQRGSVSSFLFLSFVLFMLTNRNADDLDARTQYQDAVHNMEAQLSNYSAWINGTESNFTLPAKPAALDALVPAFVQHHGVLDPLYDSYYSNLTGYFHGETTVYNLTDPPSSVNWTSAAETFTSDVNSTRLVEKLATWNWTASTKLGLSVVDKFTLPRTPNDLPEDIACVHGRIELTDWILGEDLSLYYEGVHFVGNGTIYGIVDLPGKHPDIRLIPAIVPSAYANATARVIEAEMAARIGRIKDLLDSGNLDTDTSDSEPAPKSTCALAFFGQAANTNIPDPLLREVEAENQNPTGITVVNAPRMHLQGVLISKECALAIEFRVDGISTRKWYRKVTTYSGTAALLYLIILVLLWRQVSASRTPAGMSRVSRWPFLAQAVVDSVAFAGHITFSLLTDGRASVSLFAPAFLAFALFFAETQFALLVHQIQAPEDAVAAPAAPATTQAEAATEAPGTPAAAPAPAPATPQPPGDPSFLSWVWSIYVAYIRYLRTDRQARVWMIMALLLVVLIHSILAPSLAFFFTGTMYASFWLPQIVRSARRGRTSGLNAEYVLGVSVCRLGIATYFLGCPQNVLEVEPRGWIWGVAAVVLLEVVVLLLQDAFGPAFFLPRSMAAAPGYDYHPPLAPPDAEAPERALGDCAICMDAIARDAAADEKERRGYSLAPCHHLFHTECLERWLAIKNICPQCRRPLPPLN